VSVEEERRLTREAMHRRVEDSLAYRLTLHRLRTPEAGELLEYDLDGLPLFVAIGALSDDQASAWLKRFTLAAGAFGAPDSEVVDEAQRDRARELLERALTDYEASRPGDRRPSWRFRAVLGALKAVGAVSADEASEWDREFDQVLERKSKPKREARQRAERREQRESGPELQRHKAAELSRVVAGPSMRLNGVAVTCAELYEDCVIVRWQRVLSAAEVSRGEKACADQPQPEELAAHFGAVLSLEDDLGTDYGPVTQPHQITGDNGRLENDKPVPVWGRSVFVPAVPQRADRLMARRGQDEFALELS
jgi:hypothetical protein